MSDAETLREGARIMLESVGPEAWAVPLIAGALIADANRLDAGEHVDDLDEGLALAQAFIENGGADR